MNGNSWMRVYAYNSQKDSLLYAGELNTDYTVKPALKEIWIEYEGSWYMPEEKTIKKWIGNHLVTKSFAELRLKRTGIRDSQQVLSYYLNPFWKVGKDTLVLKYRNMYELDKKATKTWDDFFK